MQQEQPQKTENPALYDRVVIILEQARANVVRTVNSQMVIAYWLIGREIVQEEQKGKNRAEYGARLMKNLAQQLSEKYDNKGFSLANLKNFRQFYLVYADRQPELITTTGAGVESGVPPKSYTLCSQSDEATSGKSYPAGSQSTGDDNSTTNGFLSSLSWSHYRALMRVQDEQARSFYEIEAAKNRWTKRQLERQINSLLFERLAKSRDEDGVMQLANEGQTVQNPVEMMKDPMVLEFLNLPESHQLTESDVEAALISHLQDFLLELGNGFAFVGRQQRLTLEGDHFYPDLVFYHIKLKCYVIIDLKTDKLAHGDLGQMLMYVHYYDREICESDDNPTVGLVLCTDRNDTMVKYVLDEQNQRIFTSRYQLYLPSTEELRRELIQELDICEAYGVYHTQTSSTECSGPQK